MKIEFVASVDACDQANWNRLNRTGYPFLRHEFLAALEHSGSVGGDSGWEPRHLIVREAGELLAVAPLYLKHHSYGEYVFDWSWADAYHRHGRHYYPKLVTAVPFTPATGPRLLSARALSPDELATLVDAVQGLAAREGASGWHVLFPEPDLHDALLSSSMVSRSAAQFHWFNQGYGDFDDFLSTFSSRKRKALRKERRRVETQGVELVMLDGRELGASLWEQFHLFYQLTYAKRSGHGGYLKRGFFEEIAETMPESVAMALARADGEWIAGALNFIGDGNLYGRYWGALREYDCLHFEACYYQGIDYCIRHGLARFDPGAQGEHKIQRGFTPVETRSCHWLVDPDFHDAITRFCDSERKHIAAYIDEAGTLLPFRRDQE